MDSPFPGVDLFLEWQGLWPDFHPTFINCLQESLLDRLSAEYDARLDERVYLMELPDVALEFVDEVRERFIRILHREDRGLVAIIELLSPGNKSSESRGTYLKRAEVHNSPVHLVELDLLLGGQRLPMGRPLPPAHYYAFVSRSSRRPDCDVYPWTVRQPLPKIPIPLRESAPEIIINLNDVFREAYRRGRYGRAIDYAASPDGPLSDEDRRWAAAQAAPQS